MDLLDAVRLVVRQYPVTFVALQDAMERSIASADAASALVASRDLV